jgi:hypothetical protein
MTFSGQDKCKQGEAHRSQEGKHNQRWRLHRRLTQKKSNADGEWAAPNCFFADVRLHIFAYWFCMYFWCEPSAASLAKVTGLH